MSEYRVKRVVRSTAGAGVDYGAAEVGRVEQCRPESGTHTPGVEFRVVHDGEELHLRFDVKDRYVRSVQTEYQSAVCTDSCVEFFVQPVEGKGYFNFEVNAGGTLLVYYIEDATRGADGRLRGFHRLPAEWGQEVRIRSSLPRVVEPEITEPVEWSIEISIPLALFDAYCGAVVRSGGRWRANFYKCGDKTSHPHWLSWAPLSALNFHLPDCFGSLVLE